MANGKQTIRIGLLGFGSMGRTHTWAVKNLPFFFGDLPFEAQTVGVCTTSMEKSERVCSTFGIPLPSACEDDLIYSPDVDVIDICTPNVFHFETLKKAILAGKHVLCEKPLCINPAQAAEIEALADVSGSVCGMTFNNRWLSPVMRAKQLVDEGRLGRILRFDCSYLHNSCIDPERTVGWKQDKTVCGGGVLFDLGSHAVDLISFLCGRIVTVSGASQIAFPLHKDQNGNPWETNADEAFDLLCRTADGAQGVITVSKISQGVNDELSFGIYGEKGALKFSLMNPNWLDFYDASAPSKPIGGERGFVRIECVGRYPDMIFPSPKAPAGWLYGHLESMKSYLCAVATGSPFSPSLAEGAYVQRVMDAAYRSDLAGGIRLEV